MRDDKLNPGEAATRTLELVASSSAGFPSRFNLRLSERLDQEAVTMSGGEQQMLAIARAMIAKPDLIMLDEPSEGIMPVLVDEMFELFRAMKVQGTTILLVEQNVELALVRVDRSGLFVRREGLSATPPSAIVKSALAE